MFKGFHFGDIVMGIIIGMVLMLYIMPTNTTLITKYALEKGFAHYDQKTGELIRDSLNVHGDTIFVIRK